MSFYKTFKTISKRGNINGVKYEIEEYTTYYYPYERLRLGECNYVTKDKFNVADIILAYGKNPLNSYMAIDQYGNGWYLDSNVLSIAYADGEKLNNEPTHYYTACQLISKHANLTPNKYGTGTYEYCYQYLRDCHDKYYQPFNGEYVPNYQQMFEVKHKIGDRIFYVKEYDSDTRNGRRKQIHDMIIRDIDVCGGVVYYYNYKKNKTYFGYDDVRIQQTNVRKSVEELTKIYNETLYMWHSNGRCSIEPCKSTEFYLKYNAEK